MSGLQSVYFIFPYTLKESWILCGITYCLHSIVILFRNVEDINSVPQNLYIVHGLFCSLYPNRSVAWNFNLLLQDLSCGSPPTSNMQPQSHTNLFIPRTQLSVCLFVN